MIFALALFVASLPTNVVHILIFFFVTLALIFLGATYFSLADGMSAVAESLKKTAGACCFIAGIVGWYVLYDGSYLFLALDFWIVLIYAIGILISLCCFKIVLLSYLLVILRDTFIRLRVYNIDRKNNNLY